MDKVLVQVIDDKVYKYNTKRINNYISLFPKHKSIMNSDSGKKLVMILVKKIPKKRKYVIRLRKEFELIEKFKFANVFLQVYEILKLTRGIPHIIRGSAGSCLLCYLMGITNIDPIEENIELSRFMHKDRRSIPDIDIDFPASMRNLVYKKIFKKWEDNVARISNKIMYKSKSAVRECVRKHGHRKFLPRDADLKKIFGEKEVKDIFREAGDLVGSFRCYSLHCGGIVILDEKIPDEYYLKDFIIDKNDKTVGKQIKLNKVEVEDNGMIKIDILSNRGLSQIVNLDSRSLDSYVFDDTIECLFSSGSNLGITHAESRGIRKIFMTIKPNSIFELAVSLALIRPAASAGFQKADFLRNYNRIKYTSSDYIIFDDDATDFIKNKIGCDEATADNYRRAFAKNNIKVKNQFIKEYIKVVEKEDLETDQMNEVVQYTVSRLERLEEYSFCKSHAYSYAKLVLALAYHKCHNTKKFWLATINSCNSSYRKWVHIREAISAGLEIVPGKKPFTLKENILIPTKEYDRLECPIKELFTYGYWSGPLFLPGMYYEEYEGKQLAYYKNSANCVTIGDRILYAKFKGIVATGRGYKKDDNTFLTFVTIGTENGIYHDVILDGYFKISSKICLEGTGVVKDDGCMRWIEAQTQNFPFLTKQKEKTIEELFS